MPFRFRVVGRYIVLMLRRNVLIFHLGALGDFVLTWPFALALSRIYPQSRIIYVTHGEKARLVEKVLGLESNDVENGWHALFGAKMKLSAAAGRSLTGANAVYSFLGADPVWMENVRQINPEAKLVMLEGKPPDDFAGHACQWILEQLKNYPVEHMALEQILNSVADRGVGFRRTGGEDIVIHPGSGGVAKCWPLENFLKLAEKLRSVGRTVRFVIGEVERERWSKENFAALTRVGDVREPANYLELLDELATASVFVGNDSGPGHLAGIIGVPTVSIFTSTNPVTWKPWGPKVHVLNGPQADDVLDVLMGL